MEKRASPRMLLVTTYSNFRLEFLPLRKVKEIRAHTGGGIVSLEFLNFSQARPHDWYILTASSDMTARILLLEGGYHLEEKVSDENVDAMEEEDLLKNNKYEPPTLRAHKDPLVGAYYVSRDLPK